MSFTADSVTAEANAQNRFVQNQPAQNRQSKDPSRVAIIVLGAGSGTRLGEPIPKAAVRVQGRTLLDHALRRPRVADCRARGGDGARRVREPLPGAP